MVMIAPSILSADFLELKSQIHACEKGQADMLHVDVMDGNFVPNITMGPGIIKDINRSTEVPLDVHLMIDNPDEFIEEFCNAGADYITVHQEALSHLDRSIQKINSQGINSGVSINPATAIETIKWVLSEIDMVLVMSVNPGFGGQKFIPYTLEKISELDKIRRENNYDFKIQVDGGVNLENASEIISYGADILVAGSAIFKSEAGIKDTINSFKNLS